MRLYQFVANFAVHLVLGFMAFDKVNRLYKSFMHERGCRTDVTEETRTPAPH